VALARRRRRAARRPVALRRGDRRAVPRLGAGRRAPPLRLRAGGRRARTAAEHGRLPRIVDALPWEAWAINTAHPTRSGLAQAGAVGQSYEAWQPPLYYLAATPVFLAVGDHRHKVFAWFWRRAGDHAALVATAGATVILAARWTDMAGRFYFIDLGAHLGI
jgi:hypothetical protein